MILSHGRSIQKMEISKNTSQILPPEKRSHIAWRIWRLPWNTLKYQSIYWFERATSTHLGIDKVVRKQVNSKKASMKKLVNNLVIINLLGINKEVNNKSGIQKVTLISIKKVVNTVNLVLRASTACCSLVSCSSLLNSSTFLQSQSIKFPWALFNWTPSVPLSQKSINHQILPQSHSRQAPSWNLKFLPDIQGHLSRKNISPLFCVTLLFAVCDVFGCWFTF